MVKRYVNKARKWLAIGRYAFIVGKLFLKRHLKRLTMTEQSDFTPLNRHDRICVVADFQGKNPLGAIARRVGRGVRKSVVFADTQVTKWLYNPLLCSESEFKLAIDKVLSQVQMSNDTHLHLELGLFGKTISQMRDTILEIINKSKNLVVIVHSLHMNDATFAPLYKEIICVCEEKRKQNTVLMWVNNVKDKHLLSSLFKGNIVYQPVLYFSERSRKFLMRRGATKRTSCPSETIFIGVFGFINAHKDFETTIRAFCLLPKNFQLIIVGGAHPGERKLHSLNPSIVSLNKLIWDFRDEEIIDRITFLDDLGDIAFFTQMASLDVVVINYIETAMSASAVLSQALELGVPVVASRCTTFEMAQEHFGKSFEFFEPGNSIQLRQKILSVTKNSKQKRVSCSKTLEENCSQIKV